MSIPFTIRPSVSSLFDALDRGFHHLLIDDREDRRTLVRRAFLSLAMLSMYGAMMGSWGVWYDGGSKEGWVWVPSDEAGASVESTDGRGGWVRAKIPQGSKPVGDAWLGALFAAIKVPLLVAMTFLICLPGFFIFYAVAGLSHAFRRAMAMLISTQLVFALALLSLAPLMLTFYASSDGYLSAILVNGLVFGTATAMRQIALRRSYRRLVAEDRRHRLLLHVWMTLYVFVGIQMGWVLRPFFGVPGAQVSFLREDAWSNAYEAVMRIVCKGLF